MKKEMITGRMGYEIPCVHTLTGNEEKVVIIAHGFGSSKESPTASMLLQHLPKLGIGAAAFDFPAHGESPVDGSNLTVTDCLAELEDMEAAVRRMACNAQVFYFGSSFGAYILLLYLASGKAKGKRAFLRSAAVEMPRLLRQLTEAYQPQLERQGFFLFDADYVRPLKLTQTFFEELDRNDVFQRYQAGTAKLAMIHGSEDETASPQAAIKFAQQADAEIAVVPGGNHSLSFAGMPEKVLSAVSVFFE